MPFPAGLAVWTVTGTVYTPPNHSGEIRVTFSSPNDEFGNPIWMFGPSDDAIVPPFEISAVVDASGNFQALLPATNDPGWTPNGFSLAVRLSFGNKVQKGTVQVAYDGGDFNLADRFIPDTEPDTGVTYALVTHTHGAGGGTTSWADITGKPATFPPSAHNHPQSDVTGLGVSLAAKADLASPALTGNPTAPTQTAGNDTTRLATTAFVTAAVAAGGGGGGAASPTFARAHLTGGDITTPADAGWTPVAGLTLALPAAVGDDVELSANFLIDYLGSTADFFDPVVLVGGAIARAGSSNTNTPVADGDPALYPDLDVRFRGCSTGMGFTVAAGDLDGGNVVFGLAHKGAGGAKVFAGAAFPFRWRARNDH